MYNLAAGMENSKPLLANKAAIKGESYSCKTCDKRFSTVKVLEFHEEAIHKGIKLKCKLCDKEFSYKSALRNHIKSKHEGTKYQCEQCQDWHNFVSLVIF